jgi:quinol monooxygenase YgiN
VVTFLTHGLAAVTREPDTLTWYAFRTGETTFGIYDTFHEENARQAHLSGEVAEALGKVSADLFASPPDIRRVDVIAAKRPR